MMDQQTALDWCARHQAVVTFLYVYSVPRVRVKACGYPFSERNTFVEAVEAAKDFILRSADALELHADCCK